MTTHTLLVGGYTSNIRTLRFDTSSNKLELIQTTETNPSPSWIEPSPTTKAWYSVSENEDGGRVFSYEIDAEGKVQKTGELATGGVPAHVHALKDGSGVIVTNFMGGTALYIPVTSTGALGKEATSKLELSFIYGESSKAPNTERQDGSHPHQTVEGPDGTLYIPDLGSDRIWAVGLKKGKLELKGELEAPGGSGPRHAVFSEDGKLLYVLTEMGHSLLIFPLSSSVSYPLKPLELLSASSVIPPGIPVSAQEKLDSGELQRSPLSSKTLYATNRWQLHIKGQDVSSKPPGDAIAIALLSEDGKEVEEFKHVGTGCDVIRALGISADGKYAAAAGQEAGGVEIYEISGERADDWKLVASLRDLEQVTDVKWV